MKEFFSKIFSREEVNTGRQIEVDIAKAICIIGMIFVHAFEQVPMIEGSGGVGEFVLLRILNTLFGATTFMFCMGLGISYTRKNEPNTIIFRGFVIFVIGAILNFLRFALPILITMIFNPDIYTVDDVIISIMENDILYFAGLAMMLLGLLKKLKTPLWGMLLIAVAMSIAGTFLQDYNVDNLPLNLFLGWFVGMVDSTGLDTSSYFPLFNWFIMVVAGYAFAAVLKRVKDKNKFYLVFSLVGLIIVAIYCAIGIPFGIGVFGESFICTYHIRIYDALVSVFGAVAVFGMYFALSKILPQFLLNGASALSKYINTVYCIQWIIYGDITVIFEVCAPDFVFDAIYVVLIAIGVIVISTTLAWLYKSVLPRVREKNKQKAA